MRSSLWFGFVSLVLFASCAVLHSLDHGIPDEKLSDQISENLRLEIGSMDREASLLMKNVSADNAWESLMHSFYLVDHDTVVNWNKTDFLPDLRLISPENKTQYFQLPRGSFVTRTWIMGPSRFLLCVLPLYQSHKVTNRYLSPEWNKDVFANNLVVLFDPGFASGTPVKIADDVIFRFEQPSGEVNESYTSTIFYLGWCAGLCFLFSLYFALRRIHQNGKYGTAFLILFAGLMFLRLLMTAFGFPRNFSNWSVFDPLQFASSVLSPSIGDFFLNSIFVLMLGIYFFFNYPRFSWFRIRPLHPIFAWPLPIFLLLMAFFSLVYPFLFIETIFHNSSISLDITQSIDFDPVRLFALFSVVISSVTGFLFSHVFFQAGVHGVGDRKAKFFICLSGAALALFLYYQLAGRDYLITLLLGYFYFSLLYVTHIYRSVRQYSFTTFLYLLLLVTVLSIQGAISIKRFVEEEQRDSRYRFANAVLIGRDILGEYLLRESTQQISRDPFIQVGFSSPFITLASIRQKIRHVFINSYFDRYDIQIRLYNSSGQSLDGLDNMARELRKAQKEADTQYPGIYLIRGQGEGSGKQYLVVVPVERSGFPVGFVMMELSRKKVIPQSVYPELLVDNRFSNYFNNKDFSYAFFSNRGLTGSFGEFNYEKDFRHELLSDVRLYNHGIFSKQFYHSGIEDDEGNVAVVSSPRYTVFSALTNFSFLFILGLILICVVLIAASTVIWRRGEKLSYAARIQVFIFLAFLLPLVAVTLTTVGLIGRSARNQLRREFLERSKAVGERLGDDMSLLLADSGEVTNEFEARLVTQAKLANLDASVFSMSGKLIASSQPLIFQDQLVSTLMNRAAWKKLILEKEDSYVADESIGLLRFSNSYIALRSSLSGNRVGIVSVPFFDSENSLQHQQINVMSNILIIFVAVFILFSMLSFFAVQWLTFPLQLITKTLSQTTLTGQNRPLQWKSDDEIGLMVKEYNKMVENLEHSKLELARTQKESAWREIAKQIAHEIKNPLTPMRLTLQRMEQFIASGGLTNEMADKSIQTLLTQVEILNDIASSFSAFARMPAPILEKLEIRSLINKVLDLHSNQPGGEFLIKPAEPTSILGDEQLLIRVFSNIILNALQSVDGEGKVKIEIETQVEENFCLVAFRDNGKGIDSALQDKVFLPHFSTKKSGSGLGLAIAKQGVEQSGGAIWFESQPGMGTTFYVKLPLTS